MVYNHLSRHSTNPPAGPVTIWLPVGVSWNLLVSAMSAAIGVPFRVTVKCSMSITIVPLLYVPVSLM
jgi:hypothetical protein